MGVSRPQCVQYGGVGTPAVSVLRQASVGSRLASGQTD
jgi:hypothetical protein